MLLDLKNKPNMQDLSAYIMKMIDKVKAYHIKDGYWYFEEKKLCKAEARDGKDGLNGKDGKDGKNGQDGINGKDGRNGIDGKNGLDGKNGKDGRDGKDGITPVFEFVDVETLPSGEQADVEITRKGDKYSLKLKIPKGKMGNGGARGFSAYEVWLREGNNGTQAEYLASLKGESIKTVEITYEDYLALETKDSTTIYHESDVII